MPHLSPHLITTLSAWTSRLMTVSLQLVAIRLLVENLGLEQYAVFALLTGLLGWFLLSDLGLGVSLQNHISEIRAQGGDEAPLMVAARLILLLLLALYCGLSLLVAQASGEVLLGAFPFLSADEKVRLLALTAVLSCTFGLSSIIYKVWYAQQKGYLANLLPALAACLMLGGVWLAQTAPPAQRLQLSVVAFLLPNALLPTAVLLLQALHQPFKPPPWRTTLSLLRPVIKRASGFWLFALMAALTLHVDYLVISQHLGATDIALYALISKVLGLFFFIYNALLQAVWPTFTEMAFKGDWPTIWSRLRRYLQWGLAGMILVAITLPWTMKQFFLLLAPTQALEAPTSLLLLAGGYQVLRVWTDTFAMMLQSVSQLRPFWLLVPLQAVTSVLLQLWLVPQFGLYGTFIGLTLSFLLTVSWGLPYFLLRHARASQV